MTRPIVVDGKPYEGWLQIAEAMGCHERTARRWAKHPNPGRRIKYGYDPFGRVYAKREWVQEWVNRNSRVSDAAQ